MVRTLQRNAPHGTPADAAMDIAFATTLEDDESFTTLDLAAQYFKPIWNACPRRRAGRQSGPAPLASSNARSPMKPDTLIAKAYSSCRVLHCQHERGR
jgi:hypothetical protein